MKRKIGLVVGLVSPPCSGQCSCKDFLVDCANRLADEETVWRIDELAALEDTIYVDLCCVAHRCLDGEFREYAKTQLMDPHWDRQKERDKFRLQ